MTGVLLKIHAFWCVMVCHWASSFLHLVVFSPWESGVPRILAMWKNGMYYAVWVEKVQWWANWVGRDTH